MTIDPRFYKSAESWLRDTRSERGYTKEEVNELAEQFQAAFGFVFRGAGEFEGGTPVVKESLTTETEPDDRQL